MALPPQSSASSSTSDSLPTTIALRVREHAPRPLIDDVEVEVALGVGELQIQSPRAPVPNAEEVGLIVADPTLQDPGAERSRLGDAVVGLPGLFDTPTDGARARR